MKVAQTDGRKVCMRHKRTYLQTEVIKLVQLKSKLSVLTVAALTQTMNANRGCILINKRLKWMQLDAVLIKSQEQNRTREMQRNIRPTQSNKTLSFGGV